METTAVAADIAVSLPAEFEATTRNRIAAPTSAEVSVYVFLIAPLIVEHAPPFLSQRSQAYSYLDGLFVHVPFVPVSVEFSCGVPEIAGRTVLAGLPPATTTAVAADVAVVDPSLLVAVTRNRTVCPSSAAVNWYCVPSAPLIVSQLPPLAAQRSHAYSYLVGLPVQVPRSPVSTCPTRAAPMARGGEVLTGFALAAAKPEPTVATATTSADAAASAAQ